MNRNLSIIVLLAASLTSVSCGRSMLLTDLTKQVDRLNETIQKPSIVPAGGAFRNPAGVPIINLTSTTPGSTLIYNTENAPLSFNLRGQTIAPTKSDPGGMQTWAAGSLFLTYGLHTIQAQGLRDGKVSDLARADFRIVGNGGTVWARAGLGVPLGQVLAAGRYGTGTNYFGGWAQKASGSHHGFLAMLQNDGSMSWMTTLDASLPGSSSTISGLAVGSTGEVYVAGTLTPAVGETFVQFGGGNKVDVSSGVKTGFLARYDISGACQWVVGLRSTAEVFATGVSIYSGTIYVCGWVEGSGAILTVEDKGSPLGPYGMPTKGAMGLTSNAYIAKYTTLGNPLQVYSSTNALGVDRFYAIAAGPSTIAVVGAIRGSTGGVTFDYSADVAPTADAGQWNALIVTFNGVFVPQKARAIATGGAGDSIFQTVAVTSINVVAGGYQTDNGTRGWGSARFWTGTSLGQNAVVVEYDASGNTLSVSGLLGNTTGSSAINGLSFNTGGSIVYAVGRSGLGTQVWDSTPSSTPFTVTPPTGRAPFVVKLSPSSGIASWVTTSFPGSTDGENFSIMPGPSTPQPVMFVAGAQYGQAGIDWNGMRIPAPSPGDNPLVYQIFD